MKLRLLRADHYDFCHVYCCWWRVSCSFCMFYQLVWFWVLELWACIWNSELQ